MKLLPLLLLACLLAADSTLLFPEEIFGRRGRILSQIHATGWRIVDAYWKMRDTDGDPGLTGAYIGSLLLADSLVDSARFGINEVIVYGVYDSATGGIERTGWMRSSASPDEVRSIPIGGLYDGLVLGIAALCSLALLALLDFGWNRQDQT